MTRRPVLLLLLAACAPRSVDSEGGAVVESSVDCNACLEDMVACVSTSRGDAQFMECRDLFGACQTKAELAPGVCSSPRGEDACALCEDRSARCAATDPDPERCDQDLDVCRSRLDVAGGSCAPDPSGASSTTGSGGSGGADASGTGGEGGFGGGGGDATAIPCHGPCDVGGALYPECSPCVASVCDADPYCCTTKWDQWCVQGAQKNAACTCAP